ncbi:MAG: hypothetical protein IK077_16615 [Thermoguttaceae bacterium]|nr:hypothetical protein [Thermoguttaceae bacterium]
MSKETVIGAVPGLFGPKIYKPIDKILIPILEYIDPDTTAEEADNCLEKLEKTVHKEIIDVAISRGKEKYGADFTKSAKNAVSSQITNSMKEKLRYTFDNFKIDQSSNETDRNNALITAKTEEERWIIQEKFDQRAQEYVDTFRERIKDVVEELKTECEETIVTRVETDIRQTKKNTIEESVRDHLRGFSRTIPSFLMAYGSDHEITLANFDQIVPDDVFLEVTGITLENFRFLRDGGTYRNDETGEEEFFKGKLFDEIVFNDSIKVFLALKKKLANYFNEEQIEDIFDYIPNLRNNQIFTPKKVVVQMVDLLEKENPGCFDDPDKTFADLYMKSGLYLTEIVKRLYRSEKLKALYPDPGERLNHIFANQVYGLAPTEIIYQITLAFILGFKDDVAIEKHNIKLCDALKYAKKGTLEGELRKLFPERNL